MDLATIIIILATVLAGLLYGVNKFVYQRTLTTRSHLLTKFLEIKEKNIAFREELEELIVKYDAWGKTAFTDTDTNFVEYLEIVREKIEIEFSESEYTKLSRLPLDKVSIAECRDKLRYHRDVLKALRKGLNLQREMLQPDTQGAIEFG